MVRLTQDPDPVSCPVDKRYVVEVLGPPSCKVVEDVVVDLVLQKSQLRFLLLSLSPPRVRSLIYENFTVNIEDECG